ncbi:GAF domain-containing protein [uncultured Nocardioides sp.]|uniref:GAF domain-containing protein n=1 Tax=uncultured Nocardioides sp. TaxID=198441 RepID=UPI0025F6DF5C|nr:GAF domain-containing protein [uncultured Nocardioides sp.]
MEPLPETDRMLEELSRYGDDLRPVLLGMGDRAQELVPSLVGLSLALLREGLTFTLVASHDRLARIDAAQYLDGGPCVTAAHRVEVIEVPDVLDEGRWSAFARASASEGVASTLSLPIVHGERAIGGINLYAATTGAFAGHHEQLAEALGASAECAIADADLDFSTREIAMGAPAAAAEQRDIDIALGMLSVRDDTDIMTARTALQDVAVRAGVSLVEAARVVSGVLRRS